MLAIYVLELLISKIFQMAAEQVEKENDVVMKETPEQNKNHIINDPMKCETVSMPESPKQSLLASKYP